MELYAVRVTPYHTLAQQDADAVFHDRNDCPLGRRVLPEELRFGTGGFPKCPACDEMDSGRHHHRFFHRSRSAMGKGHARRAEVPQPPSQ